MPQKEHQLWHSIVAFLGGCALCSVAGPIYWAFLINRCPPKITSFLVAGYKKGLEWWEVLVLMRKILLVTAAILSPASYAASSQIKMCHFILGVALGCQLAVQPFQDNFLNRVEGMALTGSTVALILCDYVVTESWSKTPEDELLALASCAVITLSVACG